MPLEQFEADESDDVEKNYPVWSRRNFCLNDFDKNSEARKWCIENVFDTTEEIENIALQNSEECARGAQEYDQGGIHARL